MAKSVMKHQFSQVPQATIQRSSFDRSHGLKTTIDADNLYPIFCDEVLPGDQFNLRATLFGRMATPLKPIMDNLFLESFFFFVPSRLVWTNWARFNGEQSDPGDSTDFVIPVMSAGTVTEESIYDYFGLPLGLDFDLTKVNALPFRCYNLIWTEWFRDQNLQNSAPKPQSDGPDTAGQFVIRKRGKRHDYFTSALPWPQKGDAVTVPLGLTAPIVKAGTNDADIIGVLDGSGATAALTVATTNIIASAAGGGVVNQTLVADLANATGFTINQLRQSFQIQKLLERDARGGTRYIELIRAHFGVTSPDARLQRPEFLGGGQTMINVNSVQQTSGTSSDPANPYTPTPQGNLAAYATISAKNHGFTKSFTEHGYIIGLVNIRADLTYQQGLNRMWSRQGRYDFYWPALAHIGEQELLSREIFVDNSVNDDLVFGYQERYAEYRYKPSMITGAFRSAAAAPLDYWHLSETFETRPSLNSTFITSNTPIDRVIAVQDEPQFLLDVYFNLRCTRPMPLYGVPGMIDHF